MGLGALQNRGPSGLGSPMGKPGGSTSLEALWACEFQAWRPSEHGGPAGVEAQQAWRPCDMVFLAVNQQLTVPRCHIFFSHLKLKKVKKLLSRRNFISTKL